MASGIPSPCGNLPFVDVEHSLKAHFCFSVHTDITLAAGLNKFPLSFKVRKADSHLCFLEQTTS